MSQQTEAQPGATDQASKDAAAAQAAANKAASDKAAADARVAERARVKGITGSEEAKGRSTLASHLAMDTDLSVEQAVAILKASPAEQAAAAAPAANALMAAMENTANPNVGADANAAAGGPADPHAKANALLADHARASGGKLMVVK